MKKENTPAYTVINTVCKLKKSEKIIIVANPETADMAQDLYAASLECGAEPTLLF